MSVEQIITDMGKEAKRAAQILSNISTVEKNAALLAIANALEENKHVIQSENQKDLDAGRDKGLSGAMLDRLSITDATIAGMATGLRELVALPDPVGEVTKSSRRPNGLEVSKVRIPLGVIGIIYESRPNVTVDAAGLCLKSGNAVILRGGSEAIFSNRVLADVVNKALVAQGLPEAAVQVVPMSDREAVNVLLKQDETVDLIIPRGGEGLIRFVAENSRIPVLKHYKGVCHVYVDHGADLDMANEVAFNAKVHRPGVCNAMETLLVNKDVAESFLPLMAEKMNTAGVTLRGCERTTAVLPQAEAATSEDWDAEYLDLILAVKIVDDMDDAISHIAAYGSGHSEAIVTSDYGRAREFTRRADASVVLVNASTRFNDGGQLGLGAEMGISTSKLHAYGPMGLEELTTTKYVVFGDGHIRE